MVVFNSPRLNNISCLLQVPEQVLVQTFISQLAIKALDRCILDWFAWIYKDLRDLFLISPDVHRITGKLRSIVTQNLFGITTKHARFFQEPTNRSTCDRTFHLKCQTFTGDFIQQSEDSELPPRTRPIRYEVHLPAHIRHCLFRTSWLSSSEISLLAMLLPQTQASLLIEPKDLLVWLTLISSRSRSTCKRRYPNRFHLAA